MEELLNISSYTDDKNRTWFRVKLILSEDLVFFDVCGQTYIDSMTYLRLIDFCHSVINFDWHHFDKLCGSETLHLEREADTARFKRFAKNNLIQDLEGNPITIMIKGGAITFLSESKT